MVRHYLINTLVNWRESLRKNEMQRAYNYLRSMYGMSKAEARKMLYVLNSNMGYFRYEWRHPKLRELLGEW
ncbi:MULTISPECIES: hypothetical protein [Bacillus]|uniref:hypothetical protein n=1 Tax=Bacillus TaxID=1386 RepID=UPI0003E1F851|nr:hypothetical protein [Bacillus cereus]ETT88869.1 hypothetical protein C175_00150 [Bacillus cereus]MEB9437434.1 hypothetical protein [Bacillus cereus]MEC2943452.1 hypothetical protein [Bacillus cereus]MEC3177148.1 hypothetical protein [Bacillus cereus]OOR38517.1 hypothetical protein BW895_21475 [Bacillus cereus]